MGSQEERSSVLFALRELSELETRRTQEEAERQAKLRAEQAARESQARAEREVAQRLAETEARRRSEQEARVQDDEAAARVERLRQELAAVSAERERIRERFTLATESIATEARASTVRKGWMAILAVTSISMAGLAIVLALREPLPPLPAPVVSAAPVVHVEPLAPVVAPPPVAAPSAEPRAAVTHGPRPSRPAKVRPSPVVRSESPVLADPCELSDDPTCGMNDGDGAGPRRRGRRR